MPLPTTKAELLANLKIAYQKLEDEFNEVDIAAERVAEIEGDISCCDIVAYQIGWGKLLLSWEQQEQQGKAADMPATGYKWNQLGALTQSFYVKESDKSLRQLRDEFAQLHVELSEWIDALSATELFEPHQREWTGDKWAMVKWIQINTIAPYHSARTKAAVGRDNRVLDE